MAPGSVLVTFGQTKVLCTASVEERVPPWMRGTGRGWVTAEYSMLPGSTPERASREAAKGKQSGRTQEIQRLIARSLRAVCDLVTLGEVQITVDCDALQADGGTRTASICGAYVALHDACTRLVQAGTISTHPLTDSVAAVSVGIIDGVPMLDLPYAEDSRAEVDMNVVMTGAGRFVEVQGTAEGMAFTRGELDTLLGLAEDGIKELTRPAGRRAGRGAAAAVSGPDGPAPRRLVLASANPDKVKEIVAVLSAALPVELLPRPDGVPDVVEDADTLVGNARLKARALVAATGMAAVADDTGLEVDALGGAPGVYSARYAGEDATYADNVAKLLRDARGGGRRRWRSPRAASRRWRWWRSPTARRSGPRACCPGPSRPPPGAPTASATTRCSCPRAATGGPSPRCSRRRRTRCPTAAGPSGRSARRWRRRRSGEGRCRRPTCVGRPQPARSVAASSRYPSSGNSCRSATTWMQTWSAPASWWARTAAATVSASPHGMTASIRRSLPPPSMSSSPKPKVRRFCV